VFAALKQGNRFHLPDLNPEQTLAARSGLRLSPALDLYCLAAAALPLAWLLRFPA